MITWPGAPYWWSSVRKFTGWSAKRKLANWAHSWLINNPTLLRSGRSQPSQSHPGWKDMDPFWRWWSQSDFYSPAASKASFDSGTPALVTTVSPTTNFLVENVSMVSWKRIYEWMSVIPISLRFKSELKFEWDLVPWTQQKLWRPRKSLSQNFTPDRNYCSSEAKSASLTRNHKSLYCFVLVRTVPQILKWILHLSQLKSFLSQNCPICGKSLESAKVLDCGKCILLYLPPHTFHHPLLIAVRSWWRRFTPCKWQKIASRSLIWISGTAPQVLKWLFGIRMSSISYLTYSYNLIWEKPGMSMSVNREARPNTRRRQSVQQFLIGEIRSRCFTPAMNETLSPAAK